MCCVLSVPLASALQFGPRLTGDIVENIGARDVAELVAVSLTPACAVLWPAWSTGTVVPALAKCTASHTDDTHLGWCAGVYAVYLL